LIEAAFAPASDVADAIQNRLAQVGLERPLVPRLERIEPAHRRDHRVLHQIRGLEHAARRRRHPSVRPPPQRRDAALQQPVERRLVSQLGLVQQLNRRLGRQRFA
jgi:hypothetical protein